LVITLPATPPWLALKAPAPALALPSHNKESPRKISILVLTTFNCATLTASVSSTPAARLEILRSLPSAPIDTSPTEFCGAVSA